MFFQLGCLFCDFGPPRAFDFDQKLSRNVDEIILYHHVTNEFLPCMKFWKKINCFRFWWKPYTNRCTSNYVISRVKRLSSPALCSWSGAFNLREWFGKWDMAMKIPILILFLFYLLCWLKNLASCLCCICELF